MYNIGVMHELLSQSSREAALIFVHCESSRRHGFQDLHCYTSSWFGAQGFSNDNSVPKNLVDNLWYQKNADINEIFNVV
jgi:hypothetical protein